MEERKNKLYHFFKRKSYSQMTHVHVEAAKSTRCAVAGRYKFLFSDIDMQQFIDSHGIEIEVSG